MSFSETIIKIKKGQIKTHLNLIKRSIWPNFCYYLADVNDIVKFLKGDFSRVYKRKVNGKSQVPLFFRPQNPFFYGMEGFKPRVMYKSKRLKCPFPIFLLFNLNQVLGRPDVTVATTGLNAKHLKATSVDEKSFTKLPFDAIYNDERRRDWPKVGKKYNDASQTGLLLNSNKLPLEQLNRLVVRSPAEAETLKQWLIEHDLKPYTKGVEIDQNCCFFFDKWSYINNVIMTSKGISLFINLGHQDAWPVSSWGKTTTKPIDPGAHSKYVGLTYRVVANGKVVKQSSTPYLLRSYLHIPLNNLKSYRIQVFFDGELAYDNVYNSVTNANGVLV